MHFYIILYIWLLPYILIIEDQITLHFIKNMVCDELVTHDNAHCISNIHHNITHQGNLCLKQQNDTGKWETLVMCQRTHCFTCLPGRLLMSVVVYDIMISEGDFQRWFGCCCQGPNACIILSKNPGYCERDKFPPNTLLLTHLWDRLDVISELKISLI